MLKLSALTLVVSLAILCAPKAYAHGGQFGHGPSGPSGPPRAPSLPCDCAAPECAHCSDPGLAEGEGLSTRRAKMRIRQRWGDVGQVQIKAVFATRDKERIWEGYLRLEVAPLLAVTEARVKSGADELVAARVDSQRARRDYLWERNRSLLDPLLVQQVGPGALDLRVFPIIKGKRTVVTLDGFALVPAKRLKGIRLYRTGAWFLVVEPLTEASGKKADFVDATGERALTFLHERACRRLHPERMKKARKVKGLPALRAALSRTGDGAVNKETALVALPRGRRAPPQLFIGKAADAPVDLGPVPPPPPPS